jgi:hypothetical protein
MCRLCIDIALERQKFRRRQRGQGKSTLPVLFALNLKQVALDTVKQALAHTTRLLLQLLDCVHTPASPPPEQTKLYRIVIALGCYAKSGEALDASVWNYLGALSPLYRTGRGEVTDLEGTQPDCEPDTALGLIIAAALAREQLTQQREPLTTARFAALASKNRREVYRLLTTGELEAVHTEEGVRITLKSASEWLQKRVQEPSTSSDVV